METQPHTVNRNSGITYEHQESESLKSRAFKWLAWILGIKGLGDGIKKIKHGTKLRWEEPEPPKDLKNRLDIVTWQVEDRNVYTLAPKQNKTKKHVLYLHGGGYAINTMKAHWKFLEKLINETKCTVTLPDYPLAPEFTYKDSFKFMDQVYKKMIADADPSDMIIMGDSAGGGYTLALAQKIKQDGLPQPTHVVMISPLLDLTMSNPEAKEIEKEDVLFTLENMRVFAEAYTQGEDMSNYLVSPINGEMKGIGEITIFVSTHEVLYPDAKRLKKMCDEKGVKINYFVYPKMVHIWVLFGFKESDHALEQIKNIIK